MSLAAILRPASPDDASDVADVCRRSAREAYAGLVTPEYLARVLDHFYSVERLRREIPVAPGWFGFTVAQVGWRVVGVAGTGRSAHEADCCEVFVLYVDPAMQRQGLGRQLLAHAVNEAAREGATRLQVAVMPGNLKAARFYETCGLVRVGDRPIHAPHGKEGGPEVALVYERHL